MKKILLITASSLLVIIVISYALLFTSAGNALVKPVIESKINAGSAVKIELSELKLRIDHFKVVIKLDEENTLLAEGTHSLLSQAFDIHYNINLGKLSNLSQVVKRPLLGKLLSEGTIKGDLDLFKVQGKSDLAKSDTAYAIVIKDMQLDKAAIKLTDASIKEFLSMAGEKPYAKGNIDLHVQFNELDPNNMHGSVVLDVKNAKLDADVLEKAFALKISRTALKANLKATLEGDSIEYLLNVDSELAALFSKGKVEVSDMAVNSQYRLNIKELALLKSITNAPIRGPFSTQGTINGDKRSLKVQGLSNVANSQTNYYVQLQDFNPTQITAQIKDAELSKLLYLAGEPSYAKGDVNLEADISSLSPLNAKLKLSVLKGLANVKVIKKAFDINLPYTNFDLASDMVVEDERLTAKTRLNSNLASVDMKKTIYSIKTASLSTDYLLVVPSLAKLEPIIERKLNGSFKANGEIKKDEQLIITAHSDIFNGKLDAKVVDEQVDANFKGLQAIQALKMLGYPEVINAPIDGNLTYNTKAKRGKLDTMFNNAVLTRSKMTDLLGPLTNSDLTKERFSKGSLISHIDKEIIDSKVQMRSERVNLQSKKFIINSKKQLIDAKFSLMVKKYPGDIIVTGNINSPNVTLDAKSMITPEVKKKAVQEINRFLNKLF